jgi:hypothetical protein
MTRRPLPRRPLLPRPVDRIRRIRDYASAMVDGAAHPPVVVFNKCVDSNRHIELSASPVAKAKSPTTLGIGRSSVYRVLE